MEDHLNSVGGASHHLFIANDEDSFTHWKDATIMTICDSLSSTQRSTFIFELLLKLPSNDRLYLVSNLKKIAAVDFIKELPGELAVYILSFLDPHSLFTSLQVSKHWNRLLLSESTLWKNRCLSEGILLDYNSLRKPLHFYKDKLLLYLKSIYRLKQNQKHISVCSTDGRTPVPSTETSENPMSQHDDVIATVARDSHVGRVLCVTANSTRIFSSGDDRKTKCWDRQTLQLLKEVEGMVGSSIHCTDTTMVRGLYNGCIEIFWTSNDVTMGYVATCTRHMAPVSDVLVTGERVVSGSSDCSVRMWSVTDGECLGVFRDHDTPVTSLLAIDITYDSSIPDMSRCRVWGLSTNCINVYSIADNQIVATLKPRSGDVYFQTRLLHGSTVKSSYHGSQPGNRSGNRGIVVCSSSHGIYMWDAHTYTLLRVVTGDVCHDISCVVGVGSALIAAVLDNNLALLSSSTGQLVASIPVPQFNMFTCGLWMNSGRTWLDGVFERDGPLFVVSTLTGDICSFHFQP